MTDGRSDDEGAPTISIGPWRVLHELAEGGMARVVLVEREYSPGQSKIAVVKVPKDRFLAEERHRQLFLAEADTAMKLDHPNIVPVFDAGVDEGLPYFAMMFVAGRSLSEVIRDRADSCIEADHEVAAYITLQVAYGLQHAHEFEIAEVAQRIVHRDVSAKNVMIGGDGSVRLSDFGVASALSAETSGHAVKGTLLYMAPEHALGHASQKSDAFGLGTILWMLLAGERFRGDVPRTELMAAVIRGHVPPLPRVDVPADLLAVLQGLLHPEEDRRMALAEVIPVLEQYPTRRTAVSKLMQRMYGRAARRSGRTRVDHPVAKNVLLTKAVARTRQRVEEMDAAAPAKAPSTKEVAVPAALRETQGPSHDERRAAGDRAAAAHSSTERQGSGEPPPPIDPTIYLEPLHGETMPAPAAADPTPRLGDAKGPAVPHATSPTAGSPWRDAARAPSRNTAGTGSRNTAGTGSRDTAGTASPSPAEAPAFVPPSPRSPAPAGVPSAIPADTSSRPAADDASPVPRGQRAATPASLRASGAPQLQTPAPSSDPREATTATSIARPIREPLTQRTPLPQPPPRRWWHKTPPKWVWILIIFVAPMLGSSAVTLWILMSNRQQRQQLRQQQSAPAELPSRAQGEAER